MVYFRSATRAHPTLDRVVPTRFPAPIAQSLIRPPPLLAGRPPRIGASGLRLQEGDPLNTAEDAATAPPAARTPPATASTTAAGRSTADRSAPPGTAPGSAPHNTSRTPSAARR